VSVLKVGTIRSLCRNLSVEKGLVKNSRVIVRGLLPMMVEVEMLDNSDLVNQLSPKVWFTGSGQFFESRGNDILLAENQL
jgi:hypothetical protein